MRRNFLRGAALGLLLVMATAAVAFADQITADTDALATAAPHANGFDADQNVGSTVGYDYSATVVETGNANDDVFPGTVTASVSVTQNDLGWPVSLSATSFSWTDYNQNQTGLLNVTVPAGTADGTENHIKVTIAVTSISNGESMNGGNGTVTLNYTITAKQVGCTYTASFLQPLDGSSPSRLISNSMKKGRVVPVKAVVMCGAAYITGESGLPVTIGVKEAAYTAKSTDSVESFSDAGSSNSLSTNFRWTANSSLASGGFWIYNLDTNGLTVNKSYEVSVYVDGTKITNTWAVLTPTK